MSLESTVLVKVDRLEDDDVLRKLGGIVGNLEAIKTQVRVGALKFLCSKKLLRVSCERLTSGTTLDGATINVLARKVLLLESTRSPLNLRIILT